jgi:hypothetical protein
MASDSPPPQQMANERKRTSFGLGAGYLPCTCCGRVGHLRSNCLLKNHPDCNTVDDISWAESVKGRAWAALGEDKLPFQKLLDGRVWEGAASVVSGKRKLYGADFDDSSVPPMKLPHTSNYIARTTENIYGGNTGAELAEGFSISAGYRIGDSNSLDILERMDEHQQKQEESCGPDDLTQLVRERERQEIMQAYISSRRDDDDEDFVFSDAVTGLHDNNNYTESSIWDDDKNLMDCAAADDRRSPGNEEDGTTDKGAEDSSSSDDDDESSSSSSTDDGDDGQLCRDENNGDGSDDRRNDDNTDGEMRRRENEYDGLTTDQKVRQQSLQITSTAGTIWRNCDDEFPLHAEVTYLSHRPCFV